MKTAILSIAVILVLSIVPVRAEEDLPGASLYNIADHWTDQNGHVRTLQSFAGRPVILAMIYTACPQMCPLTIEAMHRIEQEVPTAKQAQFVLVSFDDVRDTPRRLKNFAIQRHLDFPHWTLLHGDARAVRQLAAILAVGYRRDERGDFDHGFAITLLDGRGVVQYQQLELSQSPAVWSEPLRHLEQRILQ